MCYWPIYCLLSLFLEKKNQIAAVAIIKIQINYVQCDYGETR